jgi:hypothetical protein
MVRIVIASLLSLLLVGSQREALLHEVDHLRAKVAVGHDKVLQRSAAGECAECALLVSGGNAVSSPATDFVLTARNESRSVFPTGVMSVSARPAPYSSRAPPIAL